MKKITLLLLFALLVSCSKEPGNIKGNIYWKYNNFIGNKGDAGSVVRLYSLSEKSDNKLILETTSDVSGNFEISKILPGKYFLVVKSKNTKSCSDQAINFLDIFKNELSLIFGFNSNLIEKDIQDIKKLQNDYSKVLLKNNSEYSSVAEHIKDYETIEKAIYLKCDEVWAKLPIDFKGQLDYYGNMDDKIKMIKIDLKEGQTIQENIDFGITCY